MKSRIFICALILVFLFFKVDLYSQCPMCKMAAESNMKGGGMAGQGLNTGILYLLALPYLVVTVLAYKWWRSRKSES
jgi:hypothetical protein